MGRGGDMVMNLPIKSIKALPIKSTVEKNNLTKIIPKQAVMEGDEVAQTPQNLEVLNILF